MFKTSMPGLVELFNNMFQFLNNIIRIFIHFFTHTYFKKIQTTLLEQRYQMAPKSFIIYAQII